MKYKPIITSLLDCDLYKFTMQRAFLSKFANINAVYEFKDRTRVEYTHEMIEEIRWQIDHLCKLRFTEDEIKYIANIYFMKDAKFYHEFLRMFKLNREYLSVSWGINNTLEIVASGPIWSVSMFEIYILAIVNEVYFKYITNRMMDGDSAKMIYEGKRILHDGLAEIENKEPYRFIFTDFGTRRRFSKEWQKEIIKKCISYSSESGKYKFIGTSNVMFAKEFNITPIGTMAHEFIQLGQALDCVTLANSQKYMLQAWADEYRGDLGTALSDTLTTDYFLKHDFDKYFSKLFDGVRHDSGDPIVFGEKMIEHYKQMGIDPTTKTIIFSDGLDLQSAFKIAKHFYKRIKVSFGIGTKLTNNFGHWIKPLNIVMKMTSANGKPVMKISDVSGKSMCKDEQFATYLTSIVTGK